MNVMFLKFRKETFKCNTIKTIEKAERGSCSLCVERIKEDSAFYKKIVGRRICIDRWLIYLCDAWPSFKLSDLS